MALLNALLEAFLCAFSEIMLTVISFYQRSKKVVGIKPGGGGWTILQKLISGGERLLGT